MLNWTMSAVYGLKPGEVILFKCPVNVFELRLINPHDIYIFISF